MSLHDFLVAPVWLGINICLAAAVWRLVHRLFPLDSLFARVTHTLLLCWGIITAVGIWLGAVGALTPISLLGSVGLLSLGAIWALRRSGDRDPHSSDRDFSFAGVAALQPFGRSNTGDSNHARAKSLCWIAWAAWVALLTARAVVSGVLEYPTNWDTITYHLPYVTQLIQTGHLYVPLLAKWFFPGNNELMAFWIVSPFSGDFFAPLTNLPCTLLLPLALYQLLMLLNVQTGMRHLGVLAIMSNYVVWHQIMDNKNDIAVLSGFVCCITYGYRYLSKGYIADIVLSGVALGLVAGIKYYALGYAAMAGAILVVMTWRTKGLHKAIVVAGVFVLCLSVWAGCWYGRNVLVEGTPLYPKSLSTAATLAAGGRADVMRTTLFGHAGQARWVLWINALWRMTGPCHVVALLLLPISQVWLFVSGIRLCRHSDHVLQGSFRFGFLAVTVCSLVLYGVTPFVVETTDDTFNMLEKGYVSIRLGMVFVSMAVVCAIVVISDIVKSCRKQSATARGGLSTLRHYLTRLCCVTALGAVAFQFAFEYRFPAYDGWPLANQFFPIDVKLPSQLGVILCVAEIILLVVILAVWAVGRWNRRRPLAGYLLIVCAFGVFAVFAGVRGERWHAGFVANYNSFFQTKAFRVVDDRNLRDIRICVFQPRSYPFAGSRRQVKVVHLHETPAQPYRFASRQKLLENIASHDVAYAVVSMRHSTWDLMDIDEWRQQHPGAFVEVGGDVFEVFHVNNRALVNALESDPKQ